MTNRTRRGRKASVTSRPFFTPGKDPVPIVQEAGWALGPVWTGAENLTPLGFDPRTVQPVASRYTDYATWPTKLQENSFNLAFLIIRHLRKVVPRPEVLLSLTPGAHTESMIWSWVIWTLWSPSSYYNCFKRSHCNFLRNLKWLEGLYVANDKERLWLLKQWIVNHLCYKETEGEIDRQTDSI